jgi:hypothetical protein
MARIDAPLMLPLLGFHAGIGLENASCCILGFGTMGL